MRRRTRRIGPALAGVALAVTPAAARQPTSIEDRLVRELEAFTLQPAASDDVELNGSFDASPVVSGLGGELVEGAPPVDGHIRTFTSDEHPGSTVRVMGVDVTGQDPARLMAGFAGWDDWQDGPAQVFVDADPPVDGLVSYSSWVNRPAEQVRTEVTAYVADELLVVIEVESNVDWPTYLQRTLRAQLALAPATATPGFEPVPGRPVEPEPEPEPEPAAEPVPDDYGDDTVAATAPEPRSGLFAGGNSPLPLLVGAAGLAVRGGGHRKRVRSGPQA